MKTYLILFLFFSQSLSAAGVREKTNSTSAVALQYAGSIGWLSVGYFRQSQNKKTELGLLYGYTPEFAGGEIHSLTLKFIYEPVKINVNRNFQIEPVQAGIFITQNFAKNLYLSWPDKYAQGYYWWTNSMRFHFFFSTQASVFLNTKSVQKISFYFETNTNDLYLYSYAGNNNEQSLRLHDIFFFGIGSKIYFQ